MSFIQIKTEDDRYAYIRADTIIGIMPHTNSDQTPGTMILYTGGITQELATFAQADPLRIHSQVEQALETQWKRSEQATAVSGEHIIASLLEAFNMVVDRIKAEAAAKNAG